ncbi:MAG TPA: LLM class flavin-dependent oxidoreductase [Vicinamibacteria bacterium]|jgi:5,10-methylenetetrahydromethanopterin reductase
MAEAFTFSIRLNNDHRIEEYVALAQKAEALDFDQFWISNDLFLKSAPVILSAVAVATKRIGIGTGILNPYTMNPSEIAMIAATLDELSGNRFHLGLAAGARDFMKWIGVEYRTPVAAVRESVAAIRRLLAGDAGVDASTLHWTKDAYLRFRPSRVAPVYIGAMGPEMLRLSGEIGDGVLPLLLPPEHYFTVRPVLEEGMKARPSALGPLDFACCIWVSLSSDPRAARRALAEKIAYYGSALSPLILDRLSLTREDFAIIERAVVEERDMDKASSLVDERMLRIGVVGGPRDVIQRLEPLVAAGARHLSFGPPLGPDPLEAVELLGREVLPYFR